MRKKSARKAAIAFKSDLSDIERFVVDAENMGFPVRHLIRVYDQTIIDIYKAFEALVLECLVAAINNDTRHLSATTGVAFPKHLTDEVCEYIVVGDGYFDFRGREGLIKTLRRFLPNTHYLVSVVKGSAYKEALEHLIALRNNAAHGSKVARERAPRVTGSKTFASSGSWLRARGRYATLLRIMRRLADEIASAAPY